MNSSPNTQYDIDKFNRIIFLNRKELPSYLGTLIINTDRDDCFEYSITDENDDAIKNPKFQKASRFIKDTFIYQKESPKVLILRSCSEEKIKASITINAQPLIIGNSVESEVQTGILQAAENTSTTGGKKWYEKTENIIFAICAIIILYMLFKSNRSGSLFVD
jgi:hypothetical protein